MFIWLLKSTLNVFIRAINLIIKFMLYNRRFLFYCSVSHCCRGPFTWVMLRLIHRYAVGMEEAESLNNGTRPDREARGLCANICRCTVGRRLYSTTEWRHETKLSSLLCWKQFPSFVTTIIKI
jgi:hypothetical protein